MMGDCIWGLIRESDLKYRQKSRKTTHFLTKLCTVFHTRTMVALRGYFDVEHYF